jgi:hypothetical protein
MDESSHLTERRDARIKSAEAFEILTDKTTPAGLPKGMTWNPHDGEGARARRLRQMARREQKDIRRACRAAGIDPDAFASDEPERAKPR